MEDSTGCWIPWRETVNCGCEMKQEVSGWRTAWDKFGWWMPRRADCSKCHGHERSMVKITRTSLEQQPYRIYRAHEIDTKNFFFAFWPVACAGRRVFTFPTLSFFFFWTCCFFCRVCSVLLCLLDKIVTEVINNRVRSVSHAFITSCLLYVCTWIVHNTVYYLPISGPLRGGWQLVSRYPCFYLPYP